jgi:hypothetical protein
MLYELKLNAEVCFSLHKKHPHLPVANPTTVSYNASAVKFYTTSRLARFEYKKYFRLLWKNALAYYIGVNSVVVGLVPGVVDFYSAGVVVVSKFQSL